MPVRLCLHIFLAYLLARVCASACVRAQSPPPQKKNHKPKPTNANRRVGELTEKEGVAEQRRAAGFLADGRNPLLLRLQQGR
eukprot:3429956-Rhodomonas_salina.2